MHDKNPHIDDDAELYALGALEPEERDAVDRHVAQCIACRARMALAMQTVLELERAYVPVDPPRELDARLRRLLEPSQKRRMWFAVAAAFALGLLPSIGAFVNLGNQRHVDASHDAAIVAMAGSHFLHAPFVPSRGASIGAAKAVFARDGRWIYVFVVGNEPYDVYAGDGSHFTRLGATIPSGAASEAFFSPAPPVDQLQLRRGDRIVARAEVRTVGRH